MSVEFRLPDVGEDIHEAEIVRWLVEEGERVQEFDPIVEVQTDKALVELPAPEAGYISEILAPSGTLAKVGEVLVRISEDSPVKRKSSGDVVLASLQSIPDTGTESASLATTVTAPSLPAGGDLTRKVLTPGVETIHRPRATPAVRHYARGTGVSLQDVRGTGPGGRILKLDIDRYLEAQKVVEHSKRVLDSSSPDEDSVLWSIAKQDRAQQFVRYPQMASLPRTSSPNEDEDFSEDTIRRAVYPSTAPKDTERAVNASTRVPFRGIRRAMAERVKRAAFAAPHVTAFDECDAGNLIKLREHWNELLSRDGQRVSYLPFIIKATVSALKEFPYFNARLDEEEQEIELLSNYNIGIAVDTPHGLFVPVVHNADQLTIREIGAEIFRLTEGARTRTLVQEDMRGSTFTITNMGPIGGLFATPILNYPEVGIIGVHQIQRKPVVRGDDIVIGNVLTLSLSFDHRVIDGASSVRFMNHLKRLIENPSHLLLELR